MIEQYVIATYQQFAIDLLGDYHPDSNMLMKKTYYWNLKRTEGGV